ncbi:endonuclease VII domain-containing protein [Nocardia salmonicida]|uniref:endonuclease VII domain-containing protein n=1 Tax=Nocardia salmonicida TaxID=53431 RepID=UPI0033DCD02C
MTRSAPARCVDCVTEGVPTRRKLKLDRRGKPVPGPRCATHHRGKRFDRRNYSHGRHILETYGITSEEYQRIYDYQGGKCAVCRRATGARKRLAVDHCHTTGRVRMLACGSCNKMLGHGRDDPEFFRRAAAVLENPPAIAALGKTVIAPIEFEQLGIREG